MNSPDRKRASDPGLRAAADGNRALGLLDEVESQLDTAIDRLIAMDPHAMTFPASLDSAAELLQKVQLDGYTDRARVEPQLRKLAEKTAEARRLLDTAAAIHLGFASPVLSVETGYLPDGASGTSSGDAGSLWVQG